MNEFKIMAMREGDPVTVTGYFGLQQGTVAYWRRGGQYSGAWTVGVKMDGQVRDFEHGGDRAHQFWH